MKIINLRLEDNEYKVLENMAYVDKRSVSAEIRIAIEEKASRFGKPETSPAQFTPTSNAPRSAGRPRTKIDQEGYTRLTNGQIERIKECDFIINENGLLKTITYGINFDTGEKNKNSISTFPICPNYELPKLHPEYIAIIQDKLGKAEHIPTKEEALAERAKEANIYIKPEEIAEKLKPIQAKQDKESAERVAELNKEASG